MPPNVDSIPPEDKASSFGVKYPSFRDNPIHSPYTWLEGKRHDDGAEGLWRIHDSLYDLTDFVNKHPGGKSWLEITKGTDITEAFEVHHITATAEKLLPKYFVRKAVTPRYSPFTFHDDGFYRTLKRNVQPILKSIPKNADTITKLMTDSLMTTTFIFSVLSAIYDSYLFGVLGGIFLTWTVIAAHNFFHQKDNFRMYYFDLCLMSSREWRIMHALSHHLHTNTLNDLEIAVMEPLLQYLPKEKSLIVRYGSWLYSPLFYMSFYFGSLIRRTVGTLKGVMIIDYSNFIPLILPVVMYIVSGSSIATILSKWIFIIFVGSFHFAMVGLNAAHHHPNIFHDGDKYRENYDWGLLQLDTVMDRTEITGNRFLVLTNFGDHALHHLFPTIDHSVLPKLYPIFNETCKQFDVELRFRSQLELVRGQFLQLARTEPTKQSLDKSKNQ